MKTFLTTVVQIVVLVGLIIMAVVSLDLPPEVAAYAVVAGAFLIASIALIGILKSLPVNRLRLPRRASRNTDEDRRRKRLTEAKTHIRNHMRQVMRAHHPLLAKNRNREPCWIVLGPQGSGKSSLVESVSGSEWVAGAAPITRAGNVVLAELPIDPPDGASSALPLALILEELKRWRPSQPIDGVLIVLRPGTSNVEVERTGEVLKMVVDSLDVQVPVLTTITHIDELPGFPDFIEGLDSADGCLGALLPLCETSSHIEEVARDHLNAPQSALSWVRQRCYSLMIEGAYGESGTLRLYDFAEELGHLAHSSTEWLRVLMDVPILDGECVRLRGVFFVGRTKGEATAPVFTQDLLARILPSSAIYATRSRRHREQQRRRRWLLTPAFLILGSLIVTSSIRSSRANRSLLTTTFADTAQLMGSDSLASPNDVQRLANTVTRWRDGETPKGHGLGLFRDDLITPALSRAYAEIMCQRVISPLVQRSSVSLERAVRSQRDDSARQAHRRPIVDNLRLYLLLARPPADSPAELSSVPRPWEGEETSWLEGEVSQRWCQAASTSTEGESKCETAVRLYREIVQEEYSRGTAAPPCNNDSLGVPARTPRLVESIQTILEAGATDSFDVDGLIADANKASGGSISLHAVAGSRRLRQKAEVVIPRAFTKSGWLDIKAKLSDGSETTSLTPEWVTPSSLVSEKDTNRCLRLREKYTHKYIQAWTRFLASIHVEPPGTLDEAESLLADLGGEGDEVEPLPSLFRVIADNTSDLPPIACTEGPAPLASEADHGLMIRLTSLFGVSRGGFLPPLVSDIEKNLVSLGGAEQSSELVKKEFSLLNKFTSADETSGLNSYQGAIRNLWQQVSEANIAGQTEELAAEVDAQSRKVRDLIRSADLQKFRTPMEGILLPPVKGIGPIITGGEHCKTSREWCESIALPVAMTTELYPFSQASESATTLTNLESFFHPESGKIAQFRIEQLAPYLRRQGDVFVQRPDSGENKNPITQQTIDFINDAHTLGSLLFPHGGKAQAEFELIMKCGWASSVQLEIDGIPHKYICDTRSRRTASWPGADANSAKFSAVGDGIPTATVEESGDFGFLRLLEKDGNPTRKDKSISLAFDLNVPGRAPIGMSLVPLSTSEGSIFYGKGASQTYLAPWRTTSLRSPPRKIFTTAAACCEGSSL